MCPIGPDRSKLLLEKIIIPVMEKKLGFEVKHFLGDEISEEGIRERIKVRIREADVCIADLTDKSPNVHFEYGWRLGTGRTVIPMVEGNKKLIYDVDDYDAIRYDISDPEPAQRKLEKSVNKAGVTGFNRGDLETSPVREGQTPAIRKYIENHPPERIDILQCSLLALEPILHSFGKCPKALIRVLLMHPEEAPKYASRGHAKRVQHVEDSLGEMRDGAERDGTPCPNIGLWYYKHEPSVAAIMVDDELIQLGWYLRAFRPGTSELAIRGHNQPGLLAIGREAQSLVEPFREYFESVLRTADLKMCIGPKRDELQKEWQERRSLGMLIKLPQ
jgi:hypothetical protein